MTVQFHPIAQLPALQLPPSCLKWGAQRWMLGRGREDGCRWYSIGARAWDHVAGRGCVSRRAHGPFPITWHQVRALLTHPCAAASSPAACPPASVSVHQPGPGGTVDPK